MKIFISDFHLGSPLFKKEKEIISLFSNPYVEEIFIVGDLLDTWESKITSISKKYKNLIEFINNCDKVTLIIKGNHDPTIHKLRTLFDKRVVVRAHEIELFGKKTLIIHGDEFDQSIFFGFVLFPFQFVLERFGFNVKASLRNLVHKFLMWKNNLEYNSLVFSAEEDIVDEYCGKYDVVISGHTHMEKVVQLPDILFINCGSVIDKPSYVVVDENTVTIERL